MSKITAKLSDKKNKYILIGAGILAVIVITALIIGKKPATDTVVADLPEETSAGLTEPVDEAIASQIAENTEVESLEDKDSVARAKVVTEEEYFNGQTDIKAEERIQVEDFDGELQEENTPEKGASVKNSGFSGSNLKDSLIVQTQEAETSQIDNQTEPQPEMQTETQPERQSETQTERQNESQSERQPESQKENQTIPLIEAETEPKIVHKTITISNQEIMVPEAAPDDLQGFDAMSGEDKYSLARQFDTVTEYNNYIALLRQAENEGRIDISDDTSIN